MINKCLYKINRDDAFSKSSRIVSEYKKNHPDKEVISLGIGDVSFPVPGLVVDAMKKACDDLLTMDRFPGYGAYYGIKSLRDAIAKNEYKGLDITADEIFVGDGTKTDSTAILELFDRNAKILVGNPMYPIYQNGAYSLGRDVYFAGCTRDFKMIIPKDHFDIIYICSPSNPVGNAYTRDELGKWIKYALKERAYIIFDNVYHDYIQSENVPDSIYEIEGAKKCCIELRSYSKNVSFSGIRCSFFVLPKELGPDIHKLWMERTINRFNGASYIAQKGAESSYEPKVRKEIKKNIKGCQANARYIKRELTKLGFDVAGGEDAPYLFVQTPDKKESWEAFRYFLEELQIVVIPGSIFGSKGKYRVRISALGTGENTRKAIERIKKNLKQSNKKRN